MRWRDGAEVDLDSECRALTLRVLAARCLAWTSTSAPSAAGAACGPPRRYSLIAPTGQCAPHVGCRPPRAGAPLAASATLHRLADEILHACRADPTVDAPLVHALIAATDPETGQPLSDAQIRHELVLFMLAGHDTTATTLTYAFWALGRHPDLQDRVAAEVAALGDRPLTPDDLPRLDYTVQVLHEALRLCPPASVTPRMVMRDIDVDGYRVEAGTVAIVGIYAMHRDPALWDHPLVFDPDRFSPENSKDRDRWQYLPFGGGPRSCIGDHFAMLEATLALATIIRRAEIRSLDADFPLAVPFTMVAGGPIRARIHTRSTAK